MRRRLTIVITASLVLAIGGAGVAQAKPVKPRTKHELGWKHWASAKQHARHALGRR